MSPQQFDPRIFLEGFEIPMASEGPLQWHVREEPEQSVLAAYVVSFWGDLRDFGSDEDVKKLVNYFKAVVLDRFVRQGCFTIDVEYGPTKTYSYRDNVGFVLVELRDYEPEEIEPL